MLRRLHWLLEKPAEVALHWLLYLQEPLQTTGDNTLLQRAFPVFGALLFNAAALALALGKTSSSRTALVAVLARAITNDGFQLLVTECNPSLWALLVLRSLVKTISLLFAIVVVGFLQLSLVHRAIQLRHLRRLLHFLDGILENFLP